MLSLPNGSHLQIALLYRSPSVHMNTFMNVLVTIINQNIVSVSDIPTLLMGDFNEDVLCKSDSRILTAMSSYGYEQN